MQNLRLIGKKLILISLSLIIIGIVLVGGYKTYTELLTKNALIQVETSDEQIIQIQGKLAVIQNPFTKDDAFWIPWSTSGTCNTVCYIEVPSGTYEVSTAGASYDIDVRARTHIRLDMRVEEKGVNNSTEEIQKTPQQMLEVFISAYPEYQQTKRKILSDIQVIIIYTTPIRIYDSLNNSLQDTIRTDEPILTRDTDNALVIDYR